MISLNLNPRREILRARVERKRIADLRRERILESDVRHREMMAYASASGHWLRRDLHAV